MKSRRFDYDVLRVFSMLGVIYLHTAVVALQDLTNTSLWHFSNLLACLFTPAVPLFFMMSGALLLREEKTADLGFLFRRRLPKILVPYLAWTALVLIYQVCIGEGEAALTALSRLLNNGVAVPYWFIYALVPIYLLSPFLKRMVDHLDDCHWHYMMVLWVVLTLGLHTIRSFVPSQWILTFTEHWTLNINMVGGYLGYFLLGAYLERLARLPSRKVLAFTTVFLWAVIVVGTYWDTFAHGAYSTRFTDYLALFTMALATSMFLLVRTCLRGKSYRGKWISCLSGLSFGIYLVHPLALGLGTLIWGKLITTTPVPITIFQQTLYYLAIALFCILTCLVISSIKPLCYLFTGQKFEVACKTSNLFALFSVGKQSEP